MQSLSQLVTRKEKLVSTSNELTSYDIQLRALSIAEGLTTINDKDDMTGWYCKAYKTLGEQKYTAICKMAQKGDHPNRLFGWLLKQELNKMDSKGL